MKAKDFVLQKYPTAYHYAMFDNYRRRTSYVILKGDGFGLEIITNQGAKNANKAWTDAKKAILKNED